MSVAVRGKVPSGWNDQTARHITERLQALERALAGGAQVYVSPAIPAFGTGTVTGGGSSGGGSGTSSGVTDHGALTGLVDDDHPQYLEAMEPAVPRPHTHGPDDVLLLDQRFYRRREAARSAPHIHGPEDVVGLGAELARPRTVKHHAHVMADVADLRPDEASFVIAHRIFGG